MSYQGDIALSQVLYFPFSTVDASGIPTTLTSGSVSVYKDNGTTESTSGTTVLIDFDARTGLNLVSIDTSTDGTFYSAGHDFSVVLTTGSVGSQSVVGYEVGAFSINNRVSMGAKKNIALSNFSFYMVSSTDHITPKTSASVTATRSIDGSGFSACANAASEIASGFYKIDLATTDLNGTIVNLLFTASGADPVPITIKTQG